MDKRDQRWYRGLQQLQQLSALMLTAPDVAVGKAAAASDEGARSTFRQDMDELTGAEYVMTMVSTWDHVAADMLAAAGSVISMGVSDFGVRPLVRGVLEHVSAAAWILHPPSARGRLIRVALAQLESLSADAYTKKMDDGRTGSMSGADARLAYWIDEVIPELGLTAQRGKKWTVESETMPSRTQLLGTFWKEYLSHPGGGVTYRVNTALTHPSTAPLAYLTVHPDTHSLEVHPAEQIGPCMQGLVAFMVGTDLIMRYGGWRWPPFDAWKSEVYERMADRYNERVEQQESVGHTGSPSDGETDT